MKVTSVCRNVVFSFSIIMTILGSQWFSGDAFAEQPALKNIGFNRHIRPILSDVCSKCHGPDKAQRKADLRLDTDVGLSKGSGDFLIVEPGKPQNSELFRRITSDDPEERMPPAGSELSLTDEQIELIRRWIEQGAKYEKHWAFVPPVRPALPTTSDPDWCQSPIDHYVLNRLDREELKPNQPADPVTLLRRVTLDLTGLPPTPGEVESFLADKSPGAYERVVDRLLHSPRFGERMAVRWLDLARYADTSGYQNDGPRYMWRWRDWVIDAYNTGMPFDQFTIEQLAGDLLGKTPDLGLRGERVLRDPHRLNQLIASAFNRNHRGNAEGGIIPEEYQVEYVVDRVETTATAWLGLTLGCARCHDHKYDPFTQKEFYSLFSYFNNVPEFGRAIKEGNSPPFIKAPTENQMRQLDRLKDAKIDIARQLSSILELRKKAQANWESSFAVGKPIQWTYEDGLLAHYQLDGDLKNRIDDSTEGKFEEGEAAFTVEESGKAAEFDGKRFVNCGDVADFGYFDKFTITAWVYPQGDGTIVSRMTKKPQGDGYYLHLEGGVLQINLVKRWLDDSMRVTSHKKLAHDRWNHIAVTYDGSRVTDGIKFYLNGQPEQFQVDHDFLNQTFTAKDEPLRIGAGASTFRGRIQDLRIYDHPLKASQVAIVSARESINQIRNIPRAKRTLGQRHKINEYFLQEHAPERVNEFDQRIRKLEQSEFELVESMPTLMVMQETSQPRDTHVLMRGQYDKRGEEVLPGVPAVLSKLPGGAKRDRHGLAKWIVDPSNPLTARVAVNRYWQMFFGSGLVSTMEDFGVQGARPTNQDLLDWLATEFMRTGWDVKAIQKKIVMSATYRQSSKAPKELLERDPSNALLARGPRLRLPAELIRDQALAASGLITERLGGPSVKIYQPEGLWKEIATDTTYEVATGGDLYRRSLYAYWKRTVSPPTMATFDAPSREACVVRRQLTNTPLQALSLLNDPTYLEAARVLAERVMNEIDGEAEQRIRLAFRLVVAREPRPIELEVLSNGFQVYLDRYLENPAAAKNLVSVGQSTHDESVDPCELAAYTTVASIILNLDEAVTKE